jgi:hypothetical protein
VNEELIKRLTRAIFALKSPPPDGSDHYRSGWDDGLEAAMDAVREELEDQEGTPVSEDETPQLTREQAEACLKIAKDWVALRAGSGWSDEMKLYEPGFHCDGWAIALTGLKSWPWHVTQDAAVSWPVRVYAEAVNDWCLGLYRA